LQQKLHKIGSSIVARTDIWPEAGRPRGVAKRPGKRREALEAEVTGRWLTLSNGFQAIEDLKTFSAMACIDSAKA
jgi:hypothetical protein